MQTLSKKGILIAVGELFLKSEGVKRIFKRKLIQSLSFFLKREGLNFNLHSFRGRVFIETSKIKKAQAVIKEVFGIAWLADCLYFPKITLKEFSDFVGKNYKNWIKKDETFAIRLKRDSHYQIFGVGIKESREKIIDEIAKMINRKVNLSKPKREVFIEVRRIGWFLYFKKQKGQGGLPIGSEGKVLSLISGGIDSPVAAFLTAKRGVENLWLHFHSFPLASKASIEKVRELAKIFLNYQPHLKIYFVPFQKAQMKVKAETSPKYRILLYRRLMFKIAEKIAKKEKCQALVTGESLGQVSSQTLPNIRIIENGIKIPILRPLAGMDKEEIINLAKKIRTFQISIKPQEDCCTLFVPKHATAKGKIETIKELEKKLEIKKIIQENIKEAEIKKF